MNIREAVAELKKQKNIDLPSSKIESLLRKFLNLVKRKLTKGEDFSVRGFGRFSKYHNKTGKRVAYDFKTGKTSKVPCKPKIKFKAHFLKDLEDSKG